MDGNVRYIRGNFYDLLVDKFAYWIWWNFLYTELRFSKKSKFKNYQNFLKIPQIPTQNYTYHQKEPKTRHIYLLNLNEFVTTSGRIFNIHKRMKNVFICDFRDKFFVRYLLRLLIPATLFVYLKLLLHVLSREFLGVLMKSYKEGWIGKEFSNNELMWMDNLRGFGVRVGLRKEFSQILFFNSFYIRSIYIKVLIWVTKTTEFLI